ncbi:MAG: hypothetical protein RIS44_1287 [Pseudomonadota bacterium]|jgi:hypothetical protein
MSEAILKALDKVEGKFSSFEQDQVELSQRLLSLEQKGGQRFETATKKAGFADLVVKSFQENRDLFEKTRSVRLEVKAAGDAITTTSGRTITSGGAGFVEGGVLGLQNGLNILPASGTTAMEYSRYVGQQGAAAVQAAEGDLKAAVRPDHSLIVQSALTIAGFSKMSRQALGDAAELRRSVEVTLNRSVAIALDAALTTGATGFTGGIAGLATAYTSLVYQGLADAVSEGVATMQTAGFNPNVVAMSPADWLAVVVKRGVANDHYLSGQYLGPMPSEMRGLRVVLSPSVATGKALLLDSNHVDLMMVDGFTVEVGYTNDDFTKNLVVLLGEMRVIPVFRTTGAARLITPKA